MRGRRMRVIVIGMNPGDRRPKTVNESTFHKRLNSWMDEICVDKYSFVNAQQRPGKKFAPTKSDLNFVVDSVSCSDYDAILALGKNSSSVLRRLGLEHFALPHPSGLNRQLNDREFVRSVLGACKEYVHCTSRQS